MAFEKTIPTQAGIQSSHRPCEERSDAAISRHRYLINMNLDWLTADSRLLRVANLLAKTRLDRQAGLRFPTEWAKGSCFAILLKLKQYGIQSSMSGSDCPYDNAWVESFFSTAKRECIYRKEYATMEEVKLYLFTYIELFYNRKRIHRALGYKSPMAFRLAQII